MVCHQYFLLVFHFTSKGAIRTHQATIVITTTGTMSICETKAIGFKKLGFWPFRFSN